MLALVTDWLRRRRRKLSPTLQAECEEFHSFRLSPRYFRLQRRLTPDSTMRVTRAREHNEQVFDIQIVNSRNSNRNAVRHSGPGTRRAGEHRGAELRGP